MKRLSATLVLCMILALTGADVGYTADSTSFNPVPVSVKSSGAIPVGTVVVWPVATNPPDMSKWLECNGQPIDGAKYPELRSIIGATAPNYTDRFLRGGTAAQAGTQVADSTRSHAHAMDQHSHTVSGTASPQSFSGSASGQTYQAPVSGTANGYAHISYAGGSSLGTMFAEHPSEAARSIGGGMFQALWKPSDDSPVFDTYIPLGTPATTAASTGGGTVWGATAGGSISGYTTASGPSSTHAAGGAETAPVHTKIRYFIRALP